MVQVVGIDHLVIPFARQSGGEWKLSAIQEA